MARSSTPELVTFPTIDSQSLAAAAYVDDRETEQLLKDVLPKWGYAKSRVMRGSIKDAIKRYSREPMPAVLIVDISETALPLSDLQALAEICPPSVNVVVLGTRDNVGLYRDLMEIGVTDYLVKPVPSDLLYKAVARASGQMASRPKEQRTGKTVAVLGVRGGVGATTAVFNTGWLLAMLHNRQVVLADLNLATGSLALEMGLEPTSGLAELLTNPDRIDRIFVDRATLQAEDRLKVLVSECELASEQSFEPAAVERLMTHLRSRYHFIIQDVGRAPTAVAMAVLKSSDVRVLVLEPTLSAARDAARILKIFDDDEETRKVLMVLSRTRPRRSGDLPVTKIEKFIGRPIDVFIPFDKKRLSVASLNAEPVARQKSAVTDAYQKLAGELLGQKVTMRRSGWLSRAFGG